MGTILSGGQETELAFSSGAKSRFTPFKVKIDATIRANSAVDDTIWISNFITSKGESIHGQIWSTRGWAQGIFMIVDVDGYQLVMPDGLFILRDDGLFTNLGTYKKGVSRADVEVSIASRAQVNAANCPELGSGPSTNDEYDAGKPIPAGDGGN